MVINYYRIFIFLNPTKEKIYLVLDLQVRDIKEILMNFFTNIYIQIDNLDMIYLIESLMVLIIVMTMVILMVIMFINLEEFYFKRI